MKILIVYASAGAGHRKAAEALYNYIKDNFPQTELLNEDVLEKTNSIYKTVYIHGYLFLVNHAKWLWGFLFWLTSIKAFEKIDSLINLIIGRINARGFSKFLIDEKPDAIISTHFLPPEIAGYLKRKKLINSKLITVITDFGVHPFWITGSTDIYAVASEYTEKILLEEGVNKNTIRVTGIPVDPKFSLNLDKVALSKKLELKPNEFTVLITTGSAGIGPVEKIVESLYNQVQIIVVCAGNKKLFNTLDEKHYPNVKVCGFIDNIQEVMAVSDVVIAKPGGLTTSEILSMEIVPLFISPIPGQETNNMKAMQSFGIGIFAKNAKKVKELVLDYRDHPEKLLAAKEIIRKIKKTHAAENIYNAIR